MVGTSVPSPLLPRIDQVAFVVSDLETAMSEQASRLGITPWAEYAQEVGTVPETTYRGRPGDFGVRYALAQVGQLWVELVQPTTGSSIHAEWLAERGPGLHHFGVFVADIDEAVADAARRGLSVVQSGRGYGLDGDGAYAYLDTLAELSVYLELIERPRRRREPVATHGGRDGR